MAKKKHILTRNIFILLILTTVLVGTGYFIYSKTVDYYNSKKLLFEMNDPVGDDYGPGNYQYPTDSIFDPKSEHFDLVSFKAFAEKGNYLFEMEMGQVTNPWGAAEGFSHQIIQVYIANGSENGQIETFKTGANVQFSPKYPWTSMIKVVSFGKTAVYSSTDYESSEGKSKGVKVKLLSDKKTIRVTIPKGYLPGNPELWSYYVLVGSQDGSGPDNYRPVLANVSRWNFGGGSDTKYHPNVLDILAPAEGSYTQEKMLGSFDASERRLALLYPVGPTELENSVWENFLEYTAALFLRLGIKL